MCFVYNKVLSCSASKDKKSDENYWIVGLNARRLFCIVCKNPDLFPQVEWPNASMLSTFHSIRYFYNCLFPLQVMPKPVLTLLDLSFPLASSDLGAETLENEFMMNNFHLSQVYFSHPILYAYHTTVVLFNCTCQHVSCI